MAKIHRRRVEHPDPLRVARPAVTEPELLEEYTYLNLKFNNGFTEGGFDIHQPQL
jgi:hypothetical protein